MAPAVSEQAPAPAPAPPSLMKKVEETAKVLTGSEEGKKIADKNRQEIQGQPSSELEFMAPAVSEPAPAAPTPAAPTPAAPAPPSLGAPPAPAAQAVSKPPPSGPTGIIQTIIGALKEAGITSFTAIGNILSQIKSETNFKLQSENLNYTSAEKIQKVFGKKRFPTLEFTEQFVKNPEALGNYAYKNTDGNSEPGDGFKYRGRGWIQHTGKAQYAALSKYLGVDLLSNPDLLNDPILATKALLWFFFSYKKLKPTDLEEISKVNKAIGFSDTTGAKGEARAAEAQLMTSKLTSGENIGTSSTEVAANKNKVVPNQTIVSVNNSTSTAVKVGAPQGSSTIAPVPVT